MNMNRSTRTGGVALRRVVPVPMKGLEGVKGTIVACGWRHSMVVDDCGRLYSCGWSKYGQLGHGNFDTMTTPVLVEGLASEQVRTRSGSVTCI
jgi:alpha-tubulin suppressor-like RCC1 family protein